MPLPVHNDSAACVADFQLRNRQPVSSARGLVTPKLMISRGETTWRIAAEHVDTFLAESGWRLNKWISNGLARRVKGGPHRDVYRLMLPAGGFYLKHFKMNDLRAWSRNLLRDCKAGLEEQSAERLRHAGIPTYQTVAYGWRTQFGLIGESYLISKEVPAAVPLDQYVSLLRGYETKQDNRDNSYKLRADLALQLGQLMGRLHSHNLLHADLHTGNFLIQHAGETLPSGTSAMKLWLIDPYPVSSQKQLTIEQRAANLSLLFNCFFKCTTPCERFRFFQAYFAEWKQGRHSTGAALKNLARRTEQLCKQHYQQALKRSDRKWQRPHSRLIVADRLGIRCRAIAELGQAQTLQLRADLGNSECPNPHQNATTEDTITLRLEDQPQVCRVFHWKQPQPWFGKTMAQSAWDNGLALHRRGFPIVRPVFFREGKRKQILIVQQHPELISAAEYLQQQLMRYSQKQQQDWSRRYEERFQYIKRKLHEHGFYFRNQKQDWRQLLVSSQFQQTQLVIDDPNLITRRN